MQDLIIYNKNQVILQSNEKIYQDTQANFLQDYGQKIDYVEIDYNRETRDCCLNGEAFQQYPNKLCEDILNNIDILLTKKAEREKPPEPTLDELKAQKLQELKSERDTREVEPIEYNGNKFDYDSKARERINAAIIALEATGEKASLDWTTAGNTDVPVTASDLKNIVCAVAVRSNDLHVAYRIAKGKVEAAQTKEDLEAIIL